MLAVALALASSLCWGLSDFIGGLQSRRQALLAVLWISQGAALLVLLAATAAAGVPTAHDGAATAWAAGAGILGLCALAAFYRALSIGTMSIVAPLSATGTAIPVLVGLASGDRPSGLQAAGMALAACGVVLAAREAPERRRRRPPREPPLDRARAGGRGRLRLLLRHARPRRAVGRRRLGAARGARPRPSRSSPSPCSCGARRCRAERAALAALLVVGFFDLLANLFFALATGRGLLSVVGVLGSLYPAVTVVLARVLLHERPTRVQDAGVAVTLAGVLAIAAG